MTTKLQFCFYCAVRLERGGLYSNKKTVDHLTPRCRGGGEESTNLVDACQKCNSDKGRLTLQEYRAVVAVRNGFMKGCTSLARVVFEGERKPNLVMGQKVVKASGSSSQRASGDGERALQISAEVSGSTPDSLTKTAKKTKPASEKTVNLLRSQRDGAIKELTKYSNMAPIGGILGSLFGKVGLTLMKYKQPINRRKATKNLQPEQPPQ